ncbi:hypothetical protein [Bifidobacterium anseris]|uniref:hypothetical protein n=1 Tax=Bifidobacterium anseris TaxID=2020963 RepID=UPI00105627C6|nr:hypothetical protein [Bifidobacterium anseris]
MLYQLSYSHHRNGSVKNRATDEHYTPSAPDPFPRRVASGARPVANQSGVDWRHNSTGLQHEAHVALQLLSSMMVSLINGAWFPDANE